MAMVIRHESEIIFVGLEAVLCKAAVFSNVDGILNNLRKNGFYASHRGAVVVRGVVRIGEPSEKTVKAPNSSAAHL
jgi:hypothetical protein